MSRRAKAALIAGIICAVIAIVLVVSVRRETSSTPSTVTSSYPTSSLSPLQKLAALPVKGRAPKTGYSRIAFGAPWSDDVTVEGGHNGCDTRNDMLRRDLTGTRFGPGNSCVVLSGVLKDPYTGQSVIYRQVPEELSPIQVDHIVPLLDAWQKGAQGWDELTRRNFANDPLNLQTTAAAVNQAKSSADVATWLPPNAAYRCAYAARIVDVKTRYRLWITPDEYEVLAFQLSNCASGPIDVSPVPLPTSGAPVPARSAISPPPRPTAVPRPPSERSRCYVNVRGECVPYPGDFDSPPPGTNALCRDGTYSFSSHRRGSCARHGGVADWIG